MFLLNLLKLKHVLFLITFFDYLESDLTLGNNN